MLPRFGEWGLFNGDKRYIKIALLFVGTEYCERYAKKENISNSTAEESGDEEDISEEESASSDDEIPGRADP